MSLKSSDGAVPEISSAFFYPLLRATEAVFKATFGDDCSAQLLVAPDGTPTTTWVLVWRDYAIQMAPDGRDNAVARLLHKEISIKNVNNIYSPIEAIDLVMALAVDLIRRAGQRAYRDFELTRG